MNAEFVSGALRQGNIVLVCGAGISVNPPATLPEWKALRDETVRAVAGSDEELAPLAGKLLERELISAPGTRGLAPEIVASLISSVTPAYFQALTALRGSEPNDNHTVIARAARQGILRHIVSTNWDDLIETALTREKVAFRVFRTNEEFDDAVVDSDPDLVHLYKIHGCLTRPESITARVEDEARGLPPSKADVLSALLGRFVFLFWGYSGADLKVDLDYLKMVSCQASAPGFLWNLYANDDYRETPNPNIVELIKIYGDRGAVAHGVLPELINHELDAGERVEPVSASREEIAALRQKRNGQLRESLATWASSSLDEFARIEAMALMLQNAGELRDSVDCYERLRALAGRGIGGNFRLARASAQAMRVYFDMGDNETAEQLYRRVDDIARTHGDLRLVAEAGHTLAESMRRNGQFGPALRAFGYGKILLRGDPGVPPELDDWYELGTGDTLADAGSFDLAHRYYAMVEERARRDGRLPMVASVLARRARLSEWQDDFAGALQLLRAADEIARALGLRREHAEWNLRMLTLQGNVEQQGGAPEASPDAIKSNNVLRDNAVVYARDAGDPLLFMQASLEAVVPRDVPLLATALPEIEQRLDEIARFAQTHGHRRLLLDVAAKRASILAVFLQYDAALAAFDTALHIASSFGDDGLVAGLLETKASVLQQNSAGPKELLACAERLSVLERKRRRTYPNLETRLMQLRREVGAADYPAGAEELRRKLAERFPPAAELLDRIALGEGFATFRAWADAAESQYGADFATFHALYTLAVKSGELRAAKRGDLAAELLSAIVDMARSWADYPLAATSANGRGLALLSVARPEEALESFQEAERLAVSAFDDAELLDDWFNAAGACEEMKRYEDAIGYYQRVLAHPRANRDPSMALSASYHCGKVLGIRGDHHSALTHFDAAEVLARALNHQRYLVQILQQLATTHSHLGQHQASIRYLCELAEILMKAKRPGDSGRVLSQVAKSYLTGLAHPGDALVYYDRSLQLLERANAADEVVRLRRDRDRCAGLAAAGADRPPGLYDLLTRLCPSDEDRDSLLLRIAAGMGFNVWWFEPRSFAAHCERELLKLPGHADGGPPVIFPSLWPMVMSTIAGVADYENQKGNTGESTRLLHIGSQVAEAWSLPPEMGTGILGASSLSSQQ